MAQAIAVGQTSAVDMAWLEDKAQARRVEFALTMTRYITGASLASAIMILVAWLVFRRYVQLPLISVALALPAAAGGIYPLLHRRGQSHLGVRLVLLSMLVLLAAVALLVPEIMPAIGIGDTLVVLVGSLFLGSKQSRWLTLLTILTFTANIVLARTVARDWFLPFDERTGLILSAVLATSTSLVVALIIHAATKGQEDAFNRSEQSAQEIERRALAEARERQRLQDTVDQYVGYLEHVGEGDLAARIPLDRVRQDDPLAVLGRQINETVARLQGMIVGIRDAADKLHAVVSEILAAVSQQVSSASEQSASTAQAATAADEIRVVARQLMDQAHGVAETAQRTMDASRTGQTQVNEAISGMIQIKTRVDIIEQNILALSERTNQISEIITAVETLASQSNMLALNASIEAARAGEQGRSFAVVAKEVRDLAEQSRQATNQVRVILSQIQQATNQTAMATEEGKKGVDTGMDLISKAGDTIERLAAVVDTAAHSSLQMVAGERQQQSGMEQIATVMQSINLATAQSLASTKQAELAAQNLNDLARDLSDIVGRYRL